MCSRVHLNKVMEDQKRFCTHTCALDDSKAQELPRESITSPSASFGGRTAAVAAKDDAKPTALEWDNGAKILGQTK